MEPKEREELLKIFSEKMNQSLTMYMENCARCGACIEACHAYASLGDLRYTAVGRAQTMRKLYENYFGVTGKVAPWLSEAAQLDDAWMEKVYETAFTCTGCRRCMTFCPFGIDTQQIQGLAKSLLLGADEEPKMLTMKVKDAIARGENEEATKEKFGKAMDKLREQVRKKWKAEAGDEVIPLDNKGANVLYVSMTQDHSIVPAAEILNTAGENWSLSYYEAVNFGAFVGNPMWTAQICDRIVREAEELEVKEVAICECGTAYRVMRHVINPEKFKVITFMQLIDRYIKEGRIKLDKTSVEGKITYHDPCQIARNGGIYEEPRNCLKAVSDSFVEMQPNRRDNWCCGGGGGLVIAGEPDFRMESSTVKVDQLKATGADILTCACEMCHAQLSDLVDEYELDMEVEFVSNLVARSLIR